MVQLYQKEKKFEIYDSVLLDLKNFMTNLLNRTTCTVQGAQQSGSHQKLLTIQKRVSTLCILAS